MILSLQAGRPGVMALRPFLYDHDYPSVLC